MTHPARLTDAELLALPTDHSFTQWGHEQTVAQAQFKRVVEWLRDKYQYAQPPITQGYFISIPPPDWLDLLKEVGIDQR